MTSKKDLLAKLSEFIDSTLHEQSQEILQIREAAAAEVSQVKAQASQEVLKIRDETATEIARVRADAEKDASHIKSKLQALVQTEDNNKFQKRTIASLTSEIATMQSTITTLEKRLKLATEEVRSLKQAGRFNGPVLHHEPLKPEVSYTEDPEFKPEAKEIEEPAFKPEAVEEQTDNDESGPQLIPVVLESGVYFWDPDTNELYEFISDDEAGEVVSTLKSIKIKNEVYYLDPTDSHFYEVLNGGDVGACVGEIVNRKAHFR